MVFFKKYEVLHIVTIACHDTILFIYISMLMAVSLGGKIVAYCNDLRLLHNWDVVYRRDNVTGLTLSYCERASAF